VITDTRFREFTVREDDDVELGRAVAMDGRLAKLRSQLGLSRQAMAEYLHTSTIVYANWEARTVRLWPSTAGRVGRFYRFATEELRILEDDGIELSKLMPLYLAAATIGVPQELLLSWYRDGHFEAVDLGILGLWVHRDDLAEVS
jgi:hypothetical protein